MTPNRAGALQIRPVVDRRSRADFIRVPWALYADDPCWVPPLLFERKEALSPKQPSSPISRCW